MVAALERGDRWAVRNSGAGEGVSIVRVGGIMKNRRIWQIVIPEASDERVLMSDRTALRDDIILSLLDITIGGTGLEGNLRWGGWLVDCGVASNVIQQRGIQKQQECGRGGGEGK